MNPLDNGGESGSGSEIVCVWSEGFSAEILSRNPGACGEDELLGLLSSSSALTAADSSGSEVLLGLLSPRSPVT